MIVVVDPRDVQKAVAEIIKIKPKCAIALARTSYASSNRSFAHLYHEACKEKKKKKTIVLEGVIERTYVSAVQ